MINRLRILQKKKKGFVIIENQMKDFLKRLLRGVYFNVKKSNNVYLFSYEVSKRNMLIIKLKENFKSEPFDAVVEWT